MERRGEKHGHRDNHNHVLTHCAALSHHHPPTHSLCSASVNPKVLTTLTLLYETSFDEWVGSGYPERDFIRSRILLKAKGHTKVWLDDMIEQIDEAIANYKIVDYSRPIIDAY